MDSMTLEPPQDCKFLGASAAEASSVARSVVVANIWSFLFLNESFGGSLWNYINML